MPVRTYGPERVPRWRPCVAAKGLRRVSVCLPARDEERTIGAVIEGGVLPHLGPAGSGLVDELVVVDDGSTDATGRRRPGTRGHGGRRGDRAATRARRWPPPSRPPPATSWCSSTPTSRTPHRSTCPASWARSSPTTPCSSRASTTGRSTASRPAAAGSPSCWRARSSSCSSPRICGGAPAPRRRDRRPPLGLREGRVRRRLRGRDRPARSTWPGTSGPSRSPRSTSGCGCTATGPWPTCAPRPTTCSAPRWPRGPASGCAGGRGPTTS